MNCNFIATCIQYNKTGHNTTNKWYWRTYDRWLKENNSSTLWIWLLQGFTAHQKYDWQAAYTTLATNTTVTATRILPESWPREHGDERQVHAKRHLRAAFRFFRFIVRRRSSKKPKISNDPFASVNIYAEEPQNTSRWVLKWAKTLAKTHLRAPSQHKDERTQQAGNRSTGTQKGRRPGPFWQSLNKSTAMGRMGSFERWSTF